MSRSLLIALAAFAALVSCTVEKKNSPREPVDFVNAYIGTISHTLVPTTPLIHLPNSLVRVHPMRSDYASTRLNGFMLTIPKHRRTGLFTLFPATAKTTSLLEHRQYSYDHEQVTPYHYQVWLDEPDILVEFSPSHQSGIYKFSYPKNDTPVLQMESAFGSCAMEGNVLSGVATFKKPSDYFIYEGDARFFVYGEFDKQPESAQIEGSRLTVRFGNTPTPLSFRYGISLISIDQARKNLHREIPDFDLERVARNGRAIWNDALSKITITGDDDDKVMFYSALYRTYERMVNITEDNQYFSAYDQRVHRDPVRYYTDDWSWDTFLTTHPLHFFINPDIERDRIRSYLRMYDEGGRLPKFPTPSGDDANMYGNHAIELLLDATVKGLLKDTVKAFEAMKQARTEETMLPWRRERASAIDTFYDQHGYYPALPEGSRETDPAVNPFEKRQAVAITQTAAYHDWSVGQMARLAGRDDDYAYFNSRAKNYRSLFNNETRFFHPRDAAGNFIEPFDYRFAGGQGARDYYSENNAYLFRFGIQHDVPDLISLMGGASAFCDVLDETFAAPLGKPKFEYYRQLPDQTGNVGQYSAGNEPGLHIPYLYAHAGKPWMTQKMIHHIVRRWFRNDAMGMPGDEDGGGLSGFLIFSMMGFYPVTPGTPYYTIGSPMFSECTLGLADGRSFTIAARNLSTANKYIQSATLNGQPMSRAWLHHKEIVAGGTLIFEMGSRPNKGWGIDPFPE